MICDKCLHKPVCGIGITKAQAEKHDCGQFIDAEQIIKLPMPAEEWLRIELSEHCYTRCYEEL